MSFLRSIEKRGADPTLPWGSSRIPTNAEIGGMSAAGTMISEDTAMRLVLVNTCVSILADAVSTLPVNSYVRTTDRKKIIVEPIPEVIAQPWPECSLQDWISQAMYSLALRGNFYGKIVARDRMGWPTMIMPLHPDRVSARRNLTTGAREYRVGGDLIPTADMFHIPALLVPGQFIGINPIEYMRGSWGLALAAESYGSSFFKNSANPSGVITTPEDLHDEEVLAMARSWKSSHQGIENAQLPAVLTGGAEWTQISINPDDAQFIETRKMQNSDILAYFRIPPHMVGQQDKTSSWGTGVEVLEISFVTNTLRSWITRFEQALTAIRPAEEIVRFDLSERLRADTLTRFNSYTLGRNGGWLSTNDIRASENLTDIGPVGDVYWGPMNFAPLDQIADGTVTPGPGGTVPNGSGNGGGVVNNPNAPAPGTDTDVINS